MSFRSGVYASSESRWSLSPVRSSTSTSCPAANCNASRAAFGSERCPSLSTLPTYLTRAMRVASHPHLLSEPGADLTIHISTPPPPYASASRATSRLLLHLCQRRFGLGEPEGHVHGAVEVDSSGHGGAGLIDAAGLVIQPAQAEVTM